MYIIICICIYMYIYIHTHTHTKAPAALEARLNFSALIASEPVYDAEGKRVMSQAMALEEQRRDVHMLRRDLRRIASEEEEMRARAAAVGDAAVGVFGHAFDDVASNGVLAFLSAFEDEGLHSRHSGVDAMQQRLASALVAASGSATPPPRHELAVLGQEVVAQVARNDANAAALMHHIHNNLHTLGSRRRHALLRALARPALRLEARR